MHLLSFHSGTRELPPGDGERSRRYQENRDRNEKMAELDGLLDKVARDGMPGLSNLQRRRLEQLSQELYGGKETARSRSGQKASEG